MRISSLLAATISLVAVAGCGGAAPPDAPHDVARGPLGPPPDAAVCSPLPDAPGSQRVVALLAAERDALEKRLADGPVALKLEGCRLVVVPACELRASARYTSAPEDGTLTLSSEADVEREVPLGKARLGAVMSGGHALQVKLAHAGRFSFVGATASPDAVQACKEATHVVRGYTIGAFEVAEEGSGATVEKAGDREACAKGSANVTTPPSGCGALVSIDLVALHSADDDIDRDARKGPDKPISPAPPTEAAQGGDGGAVPGGGFVGGVRGSTMKDAQEGGKPQPKKHCAPDDPLCYN
ncbi:hypothetical protein [Polyangium sp. 6x1]|uniref:hypothetical protein n=1 Tax=Polyangium sp. 6x1 TaxID=3042689 RepID=UPI0024832950|nr:hypothetical protein [Polyangium sp. 6x1]MDI1451263.1 hypothetical protein [Polyangium sp. 6x1]